MGWRSSNQKTQTQQSNEERKLKEEEERKRKEEEKMKQKEEEEMKQKEEEEEKKRGVMARISRTRALSNPPDLVTSTKARTPALSLPPDLVTSTKARTRALSLPPDLSTTCNIRKPRTPKSSKKRLSTLSKKLNSCQIDDEKLIYSNWKGKSKHISLHDCELIEKGVNSFTMVAKDGREYDIETQDEDEKREWMNKIRKCSVDSMTVKERSPIENTQEAIKILF